MIGTSQGIPPEIQVARPVDFGASGAEAWLKSMDLSQPLETHCQRNNTELAPSMAYRHEADQGHRRKFIRGSDPGRDVGQLVPKFGSWCIKAS